MEEVKEFNNELNSLYQVKPPISKAKMNGLTKLALKSLKHYKHVVLSIEKFIHKCQPDYKLPGLYVIDSIIRQSRHQLGPDKDPFVARFSRNIAVTFHDLFSCPSNEICKIVRVLNLWQKNSMFSPYIIQPLLDMAADPTNVDIYVNGLLVVCFYIIFFLLDFFYMCFLNLCFSLLLLIFINVS
ncbi:hypothetical protein HELRODRAFT_72590 [Helobdella robusta]|uniref:CID domain-containing protein n=1 Tax=Helobdella robusta TaxID=6412 RepID=T1G123_HELRO|nr:hypothetical protein HELRODRAFT_72590 [Helobdella robusta]ESO10883.1 hypothetical protein HELRODRAFT_72590 [Helobdella robusta]